MRSVPADEAPLDEETLERLLAASATGDEQAFARLYDRTSARLYGLVLRVIRDSAQAAEVTQDIYVQVWRDSARFDPAAGNAMAWLLMIAHRRAVDRVRASEASRQRDDRYATRQTERSYDQVSEQAHANMEAQHVRKALDGLTDNQRDALQLAYFDGYTHREVAAMLEIPLGTAKTRIRDGLIRLRDAMGER
ncbi:RNA polymerase ECF family sigma subunit [Antricoccus suffuscus]|uniref:RNA polymerase ECF family sigma subunit n=1 Tax=Antricoccus suffuscus TaxID=1629062 RepID=A0A2T1A622_9ACTN|nr:ECF RNA polymerase sigma factor SigK [Antricoccus suffuscus]PRZ44063.1 RNA polymerase ECF family sigma subunit [Antricoccus suffuscus]